MKEGHEKGSETWREAKPQENCLCVCFHSKIQYQLKIEIFNLFLFKVLKSGKRVSKEVACYGNIMKCI